MTEQRCTVHGKQESSIIFGGVRFCPDCIHDALLKLGVRPVYEKEIQEPEPR